MRENLDFNFNASPSKGQQQRKKQRTEKIGEVTIGSAEGSDQIIGDFLEAREFSSDRVIAAANTGEDLDSLAKMEEVGIKKVKKTLRQWMRNVRIEKQKDHQDLVAGTNRPELYPQAPEPKSQENQAQALAVDGKKGAEPKTSKAQASNLKTPVPAPKTESKEIKKRKLAEQNHQPDKGLRQTPAAAVNAESALKAGVKKAKPRAKKNPWLKRAQEKAQKISAKAKQLVSSIKPEAQALKPRPKNKLKPSFVQRAKEKGEKIIKSAQQKISQLKPREILKKAGKKTGEIAKEGAKALARKAAEQTVVSIDKAGRWVKAKIKNSWQDFKQSFKAERTTTNDNVEEDELLKFLLLPITLAWKIIWKIIKKIGNKIKNLFSARPQQIN